MNVEAATARYIDSLGAGQSAQGGANIPSATTGCCCGTCWPSAMVTWLVVRSGLLDRLQARLASGGVPRCGPSW